MILEMTFFGDSPAVQRVQDALDYLGRTWNDPSVEPGWGNPDYYIGPPHYQAMYCIMKGLEYAGIDTIDVNGSPTDWYAEFADAIVSTQDVNGSWPQDEWGGTELATDWALLTLEKTTPPPPLLKHLKWSQPPIETDPNAQTPTYCGWDEPSHREIIGFPCWAWTYQCHGDADNAIFGPFRVSLADLSILKLAIGTSYPNPSYNPCADFDRNFVVDHVDVNILQTYLNKIGVPGDCTPGTQNVGTGGVAYWDLFAVSLSPNDVYWNLVNGGAGSLSDPVLSPDPAGASVIDANTPLGGIAWGFGGAAWGDGTLETDVGSYSIVLMNEPNYYLSVVLDTSTTPKYNGLFASWGTISNIVVSPWDSNTGGWGPPIDVNNWVISPFDPNNGTVATQGVSSTVTLASNDFGDTEYMDKQDGVGIWGAAAELPADACGYKVDFATDLYTWDTYHGAGLPAPEISWKIVQTTLDV